MFFGWQELYIDSEGFPSEQITPWVASCFTLFTHIIYIGKVRDNEEL